MPLRRRVPDLAALAFLALLTLIFFWPVTLGLGWIPRGGGDLASFLWPTYSYAARALWAGRLPLWNNALFSGAPFAADNQSGLFYPIHLLTFLFSPSFPYTALEWLVVFHFWLAGAGMYALMRVLLTDAMSPVVSRRSSVRPALFSALAYMFSDVFITHIGNYNIVAVAAWLPWALACLHLGLERRRAGWAAGAGVVLGTAALAGQAQMTLMLAGALGLYALFRLAYSVFRERPPANRAPPSGLLLTALTFLIAFGISAAAVIPALEMLPHTARARLDYATAAQYSLPWAGLAGLFSPLIFGRGPAFFWGPWERVELGYLGVLPLFFAALAPFRARRGVTLFLAGLGLFGLLAALGLNTPVHRLLYSVVPGFAQLRVPARFILLADFSLAALAGYGLHRLASLPRRGALAWGGGLLVLALSVMTVAYQRSAADRLHLADFRLGVFIAVTLLLVGLALALVKTGRRFAPGLAVVLLAADVIGHGAWVEADRVDPTLGYQRSTAVAFLQSQPGPTRLDNAAAAWAPDAAARFGLEDIAGVYNPLNLARYQTYLDGLGARGTPLYNFLNVQFVVSDKDRPPADATFVPVFNEDPAVDVYLNTNALPRVTLVYAAQKVRDGEAAFAAIRAPDFDPASTVAVEGDAPAAGGGAPTGASNLYYLKYGPEAYTVVAQNPAPAYLVLSEAWYPGWRAWVDGAPVPIYLADFAFRAVYLAAPGEHQIEMRFEPLSFKIGAVITVITLIGLLGWLAVKVRSPQSQAQSRQAAGHGT